MIFGCITSSKGGGTKLTSSSLHRFLPTCLPLMAAIALLQPRFGRTEEPGSQPGSAGEATAWADEYVNNYSQQLRLQAATALENRESERLEAATHASGQAGTVLDRLPTTDAESRAALVAILERTSQEVAGKLRSSAETIQASVDHPSQAVAAQAPPNSASVRPRRSVVAEWHDVRAKLNAVRLQLFQIKASERVAEQLASLLSVNNRWFWLCGLVAMASLVTVAAHDRRHEIRRRLHGGRARAMGLSKALTVALALFAAITVATFFFGDKIYNSLLVIGTGADGAPRDRILRENNELSKELADVNRQKSTADSRYKAAIRQWTTAIESASPDEAPIIEQWAASTEQIEKLDAALRVEAGIAQKFGEDGAALETLDRDVAAHDVGRAFYLRMKQWIRGGLGLMLLGTVLAGAAFLRRGIRRRRQAIRDTCPLCLGLGTFQPIDHSANGQGATEGSSAIQMVECKRQISDDPYEECGFTFADDYRDMIKLCFPTLGIPQAGKTHWLAMTYRELNRGSQPSSVRFERIKSTSSERFDRIVDEILAIEQRLGPEATQTDRIPHPLVFHFGDHDRWERTHNLVNIFDYSGEVTRSHSIGESLQRQRALDGDGFFFFLDPTEPSETQVQALVNFRDDLRLIKRLKPGQTLRTPVALIVSKIDLMVTEAYADSEGNGDGVVGKFYRELGDVGWDLNLRSIEARSRLVAQLRDTIWPGWDIERSIDDLFGGRHLFFPLSPVGLNEPGERDLSRRTIAPVGLFQPLLWLLHMNGYQVLD